jgi:hypothetical protein
MIYGERIRLRAIERDDIPAFLRWFNMSILSHEFAAGQASHGG